MLTLNLYFNPSTKAVDSIIKSVIDEMRNAGADQFLTIITEPEVYAYAYRELGNITTDSVKELLININKVAA